MGSLTHPLHSYRPCFTEAIHTDWFTLQESGVDTLWILEVFPTNSLVATTPLNLNLLWCCNRNVNKYHSVRNTGRKIKCNTVHMIFYRRLHAALFIRNRQLRWCCPMALCTKVHTSLGISRLITYWGSILD